MRLIQARALVNERRFHFKEFFDGNLPQYAILSHTWESSEEVTYQECQSRSSRSKTGFDKIRTTCKLALRDKLEWVWVDTCCIDKSSSAELSEAINTMYKWYQQAAVCYAYLSDLGDGGSLEDCRWFTRGWTLQELIAPLNMRFYDQDWACIGDKRSLAERLSSITRVPVGILIHRTPVISVCVARRFSWAAKRKTTRTEDLAYCLLGLFNINMPMLYGEGDKAFFRLQEEIIKATSDLSLLAWTPTTHVEDEYCGFFAQSADDFQYCSEVTNVSHPGFGSDEFTLTSKGLRGLLVIALLEQRNGEWLYAIVLNCRGVDSSPLHILTRKVGPGIFIRTRMPDNLDSFRPFTVHSPPAGFEFDNVTLLSRLPGAPHSHSFEPLKIAEVVLLSRSSIVEISSPFPRARTWTTPKSCWDVTDQAFFGSWSIGGDWGVYAFQDIFIFQCRWGQDSNNIWKLDAALVSPEIFQQRHGSCWHDFLHRLEDEGQQLAKWTYATMNALFRPAHDSIRINYFGKPIICSFKIERVDDDQLCRGPRWRVKIEHQYIH